MTEVRNRNQCSWTPHRIPIIPVRSWHTVRHLYNTIKNRHEVWIKCRDGDEYVLYDAVPARIWKESFISSWDVLTAFWGIVIADMNWGAYANPGVTLNNFADLNEIGGGINIITGAASGNWVATDWGSVYPTTISESPHLKFTISPSRTTTRQCIFGLVGATNKPANASGAFPSDFPNDGIYVLIDTSCGDPLKFVTKNDGVATETNLTYTPDTTHKSYYICVNDDGDEVRFIRRGTVLATHSTNLPTCQLQPYFEIQTLENNAFTKHLHDFRLITDRGI